MLDDVKEECGICAVYIKGSTHTANKALFYLYKLLLNLQNRGQLSAGITTFNPGRSQILDTYKQLGHVNEVFKTNSREKSFRIFKRYAGNKGIGHVRYATSGTEGRDLAQPFERHHGRKWKWFSFGLNGNLANYAELKKDLLEKADYHIVYDTDTEILMHYISRELKGSKSPDLLKVFANLAKKFDGCYNIAYMNAFGEMVISRDPYGFRPLVYGFSKDKKIFMAASESVALINCGMTNITSLEPGYMIHISNGNVKIRKYAESKRKAHCMFEWVYFSNVSSVLDNKSVYTSRTNLGKELAKLETEKINDDYIVVPVPDTAKAAGDAYAFELKLPSKEGIIRNRYVGRTFIEGSSRYDKVQNKYTALRNVLKGKKVLVVDDSVVRGNTTKQLVKYLKEVGGAKEIHLRITCPPIRGPCFYGIDMSTVSELLVPKYEKKHVSSNITKETCAKIAKDVGADSLIYQTVEGLVKSIGFPKDKLCTACVTGEYPTPCGKKLFKKAWKNHRKGIKERTYSCR
ncbi:MAG: amidophosphoribosyltransferase [Candidatus Woesearchaeota archaeon]|mgnify:CR=1 FL=1|jgi:amidophosphoribosyltransferase|nr:amidophosphoribosyltransferase [Candidatus Woesearchaeota archaeon]MDP7622802.1 amidophosphoribosyltransferase [Candidatus Woesearchaeota archaeon]HJN56939.1 amidophosphoribosyltransferase [Candidatus Woesearchaeota archaeon]|tara:strand:+ start:79068 stop:80618 length:1551 start_codon:yes stop_codon:yes gene_type:complete